MVDLIAEEGITTFQVKILRNCPRLKSIIFPQSLEEIRDGFLKDDISSLEAIFIPKNVRRIEYHAFYAWVALREVIFEEGSKLERISNEAFRFCTSLKSIVIPKSVTTLGVMVFDRCCNLESVIFLAKGSKLEAISMFCFHACPKLKALMIPDTVTTIQDSAFATCYNLTSVYFSPQSKLQHIEEGAFQLCPNLQFINVPSTIVSIHDKAFHQCDALPITSTPFNQHQQLQWFKHGYDNLPLHQRCVRDIRALTQIKLDSIPHNDVSLIQQDECGLTPLHRVCSNPQTTLQLIKQIYSKHRDAATMVNATNMTPWHMYLVAKGVILYKEFDAITNGDDEYEEWFLNKDGDTFLQFTVVSNIAKALLREDAVLTNIHSLIAIGLKHDDVELYDITLALHGVSFQQECNQSSETTGLYPFMAMAVSSEYNLCHVYDMAMKTCPHKIQK